jgi:2'-5' RNA ligase
VVSSLKEAAGAVGRGRLEVHGLGAFPNLAAPRVVYAGLRGDVAAVTTVHARLDAGLAALGIKPEGRGYVPHITLGRVRSAKHTVALTERLKAALDMDLGSFSLEAFTLMESHLSPEGPEYVVAATVPI